MTVGVAPSGRRLPLRRWLWRSYLRAALVPLLIIELGFLGIYWGTSLVVYDRSADAVRRLSTSMLLDTAMRESDVISGRLQGISALTAVYADAAARALATPFDPPQEEKDRHAYDASGAYYTTRDNGGSAVFYSGHVPIGAAEIDKVWRTVPLDPLMKAIRDADPLIGQIYVNTWDSLNRIYPYFDVLGIYPPRMDIPSYNFYYEADAVHNPERGVVWTDAYVDPAGSGWMVSAIAPSYIGDRLEAVVGLDVTVGTIVTQVLNIEIAGDGYALLVGRDGTILALPPEGEADLGVQELVGHSYEEAIRADTFKPEEFNIFRRADLAPMAAAVRAAENGTVEVDLGRPMIAAWSTVAGPDWRLIVLTSEENILSEATTLREQLTFVSRIMLGILVVFYAVFFAMLWRRSAAMSGRVAQPLSDIEQRMVAISEGGSVPPTHDYMVTELQTVGDHLVTMGARLNAANRAKANFLSAMSHELRTPLNAILGFAELLELSEGEKLDRERMAQVRQISAAGTNLLQLVDAVMDLARLEQGDLHFDVATIDPLPPVRAAIEALQGSAEVAGISLRLEEPAIVLPPVRADAEVVRRIVVQLLSNAIKYNRPSGSAVISLASGAGGTVDINVTDTGLGIAADLQARVFMPFERLGHENGTIPGTGIGLAISRRLADLTGARLEFRSTEGVGSTFTLHLPSA